MKLQAKFYVALLSALVASCGGGTVEDVNHTIEAKRSAMAASAKLLPPSTGRAGRSAREVGTNLLANAGFENGDSPWIASSDVLATGPDAHAGTRYAWLGGYNKAADSLYQDVAIPSTAQAASLQFWYKISTEETNSGAQYDFMDVTVTDPVSGATLKTLFTFSNAHSSDSWVQSKSFDLLAFKGRTVRIKFAASTDSSARTSFLLDDLDLTVGATGALTETLTLPAPRANYIIGGSSTTGYTITDMVASGGTQSLVGIRRIFFSDTVVSFDIDGDAGKIYRLYQATFERQPDIGGLGYWIDTAERLGMSLLDVAQYFINSQEFSTRYGALNDTNFIIQLYANVLHRSPDSAGLAFHLGNLSRGAVTRRDLLLDFSESAENKAQVLPLIANGIIYTPLTPAPAPTTTVDWQSSASAEQLLDSGLTLSSQERKVLGSFQVSGATVNAEIVFASQRAANLYIMPSSEAQKFASGQAFQYYPSLSFTPGTYGYKVPVDLGVGEYAVGIENTSTGSNYVRVEVQRQPSVIGFRYSTDAFSPVTRNVAAGARLAQPVTVGTTYRTIVDGANSGGKFYIIPASETSNFLAGASFKYLSQSQCGSGVAAPGFCELAFTPGEYAIAYFNDTGSSQSIVFYAHNYVPE